MNTLKIMALAAVATAIEVTQLTHPLTASQAGALDLYLNTTSINNMIQPFVPILSYFVLNNSTWNIDYHSKSLLYNLDLNDIHFITVDGWTEKSFEMIPGSERLRIKLGGIDAQVEVNGNMRLLYAIPLKVTQVNVTGASIEVELE